MAEYSREVSLDKLLPNPWQPRRQVSEKHVAELMESIRSIGLLQLPMGRGADGEHVELAFAHHRVEALKRLAQEPESGFTDKVWVTVRDLTDEQMAYIALGENRARLDLSPVEEMLAWKKALEIEGVTVSSLAKEMGVDRTVVSRSQSLLELPASILELVDSGQMAVKAAREFLCLRCEARDHWEAVEKMVLAELAGTDYEPPDYRLKTVRAAILGLVLGSPHRRYAKWEYGYGSDRYRTEAQGWRPLYHSAMDGGAVGGRAFLFDADEFAQAHATHLIPTGVESGGHLWTCDAKAWSRASAKATRERKKGGVAAATSTPTSTKDGPSALESEWLKVVKRDPLVKSMVGSKLRGLKRIDQLDPEEAKALGTRVQLNVGNGLIQLGREAYPEGMKGFERVAPGTVPEFDYEECSTCIDGATWGMRHQYGVVSLYCKNEKKFNEKKSRAVGSWLEKHRPGVDTDALRDKEAVDRLTQTFSYWHGAVSFSSDIGWVAEAHRVEPLGKRNEWSRYDYYPFGALAVAQLLGLELPMSRDDWAAQRDWSEGVRRVVGGDQDNDWIEEKGSELAAAVLVWKARVFFGTGTDIWRVTVGADAEDSTTAEPEDAPVAAATG